VRGSHSIRRRAATRRRRGATDPERRVRGTLPAGGRSVALRLVGLNGRLEWPRRRDMKTVGILTGGGDAPGLTAVLRAFVRRSLPRGHGVIGLRYGWRGLVTAETAELDAKAVSGILHRGGTILGTSRTNPYKKPEDARAAEANFKALGLDALVAVGGEDTL